MTLEIKQDSAYIDEDWWRWSLRLDGKAAELNEVDSVTYFLHETFANPARTIRDKAEGFKLEAEGWGTFKVHARVKLKDGRVRNLEHDLELFYPNDEAAPQ